MKQLFELKLWDYETVYLPTNLNLDEQLTKNPPMVSRYPNNPSKVRDRIATILGQISIRMTINKELEDINKDRFISLNAQVMEDLVEDYRSLLDWALMVGIIETDGQYIAGEKSRGYRFSNEYCFSPLENKTKITKKFLYLWT